ncbi:MAG TPA: MBOAT family O-acyltransferase [bacterium]|nr:MBOAT family O-acyltransferase [bacterium]
MLFNSFQFVLFFILVTALHFTLPHRWRWALLLTASCYFYMAFIPLYILILAVTIVVDYFAGRIIERTIGPKRKLFLVISLVSNVGFLAFFKYYNFLNENLRFMAYWLHWDYPVPDLTILLPIGLSFHTFQAMSYTIEVFRGRQKAERHFGIFALYVMFYPQLVAGPIERPQNLIHQFYEEKHPEFQRMVDGLKLMLWGLFKKVVIADRLAMIVNQVYNDPTGYSGIPLWIATYCFAFQIYCDFSGYSDIAIGAAKVMGFRLMENFRQPYGAGSIPEFWKRWHISLSTWFKDYLYIPLGGNRVSIPRWFFNLSVVFLVSGLWHGASWTFVLWGALNGIYMIASIAFHDVRKGFTKYVALDRFPNLHKTLKILFTFHLICFAWIFFRANSFSDAGYIVSHLFAGLGYSLSHLRQLGWHETVLLGYNIGVGKVDFIVTLALIFFMEWIHWLQRRAGGMDFWRGNPLWFRWATYYAMIVFIVLFGVDHANQFIYFQF